MNDSLSIYITLWKPGNQTSLQAHVSFALTDASAPPPIQMNFPLPRLSNKRRV